MAITGNKGEWSEFYAFVKILTDGEIFAADENINIDKEKFFTVLKIIREEVKGRKHYDISEGDGTVEIKNDDGHVLQKVDLKEIKKGVAKIFSSIKNSSSRTFEINSAEEIMEALYCSQIKASNVNKSDLTIIIHDRISPTFRELGFSVKSMSGAPSTLLNASGSTNFIYEIRGISQDAAQAANLISGKSRIRDITRFIKESGGDIVFSEMSSDNFRRNLRKIDSSLPEIIAEVLKFYYDSEAAFLSDLVNCISEDSRLSAKFDFNKSDYEYKIKNLLCSLALGMMPNTEWDGFTQAHGGYLIVKEDGEIVCYHLYNRDEFDEYLYKNTKLETPSSTRHGFGNIYEEDGKFKIKYNLQIRFIR